MTRFRNYAAALLTVNAALLCAAEARAGWTADAPFGATLKGDLFVPTTPAASPAVLVEIHYCGGHASSAHGWFQTYAEQYGFYMIAPDAGKQCFDSSASRDGDKAAIVKMVDYVVTTYQADKTRVFAAGLSSGGCMTNTLLAIYPDVFAGGSAMPGFPAGAWPAGDTVCTKCSEDGMPPSTDGKYWGDIVRKVYAFGGTYGCSQQWVGGGDMYGFNNWLPAVAAEFQNLSSLGEGMPGTSAMTGWARTEYKDAAGNVRVETNLGPDTQAHDLSSVGSQFIFKDVIRFLGLDKATGACGLATTGSGGMGGGGSGSGGTATGGATSGGQSNGGAGGRAMGAGGMSTSAGAPNGGAPAAGGSVSTTGGTTSTAGATSTGGSATSGTGGATGTAGSISKGGAGGSVSTTGGATASAGKPAGGSATASAGTSTTGTGGSAGDAADSGCGCRVAERDERPLGGFAAFVAAGLGTLFARRRRAAAARTR